MQPPRYDDVVSVQTGDTANSAGVTRTQSTSPASATRGNAREQGTFRAEAAEDFSGDPDRRRAKPRQIVDLVSRLLGLEQAYTTGASFNWCRDSALHRMAFSRRYTQEGRKPDVLVDLFANDLQAVKEEVAYKQAQIRAHNLTAVDFVASILAEVEERVFAAVEREAKGPQTRVLSIDGPAPELELRVKRAHDDALLFLRRDGLVPFGYVPLVGIPREFDASELLAGAVLDIPPR